MARSVTRMTKSESDERLWRFYDGNLEAFIEDYMEAHCEAETPPFHKEIFELISRNKRVVLAAPRGHAKAQCLNSKVMTLDGWREIGDIEVGDYVYGSNGRPTKVTHLHPVGEMDLYRVTTRDGRSTLCNEEHLWTVQTPSNTGDKLVTRTTGELLANYKTERLDKRNGCEYIEYRHFLPTVKPLNFSEADLLIDPYVLGVWLGDGDANGGCFTTADDEILDYFSDYEITKHKARYRYGILGLVTDLRKLGVLGAKYIPELYLLSSLRQREALLQGLIDTDGYVQKDGKRFGFCNKNRLLIDQTVELIRSLGGTATVGENWTRFDKDSDLKLSWVITGRLPDGVVPVRLKRKRDRWVGSIKTRSAIVSIEYEKTALGRCITVENDDGLYVTDDYMLTHNSTVCSVFYPLHAALFQRRRTIRIISAASDLAEDFLRKIKWELEHNELILATFGKMKTKKWTESHIIMKNGVSIQAMGINSQTRGPRPDLIIMDDVETDDSVASEDRRASMKEKIYKALINSLSSDGQLVWVGTIISHLCLIWEALNDESKAKWQKRIYKAYIDGKEDDKHVLWPELYNHQWLQDKKAEVGSMFFASEYLNDPSADENAPIKEHMIRRWNSVEDLPEVLSCVITLDPAYSEGKDSDWKVACLIGVDSKNTRWLLDVVRTKEPQGAYQQMVINLWHSNRGRVTSVGIPNKGVEKGFYNSFIDECGRRGFGVPVTPVDNSYISNGVVIKTKKKRIIAALQPHFEQGRYVIGAHMGFVSDELLSIGKSKHDDVTDCMAYAEQLLQPDFDDSDIKEVDRYGHEVETEDADFEDWGRAGYGY